MRISDWSSDVCSSDLELVALDPLSGVTPSEKPPVRIFLGTEPAQHRAERVFVWSILQARDPARRYEIYLMKDLKGFDSDRWKTGFTNYRYAITDLAGKAGRRSEEHTSELQSIMLISYDVICLKKKKTRNKTIYEHVHNTTIQ